MKGEAGFALVITLLLTALMVAMTTEMIHQVYVDTSLSRAFRDGQQASLLAESGARGGLAYLKQALSGQEYSGSLAPLTQEDETGTLQISFSDESGKINLNDLVGPNNEENETVRMELGRLGRQLDMAEGLWDALADWLDGDDLTRSAGAESSHYRSLNPAYAARNGRLAVLAELTLVKGFTSETVERLRPFVTVYPNQAGAPRSLININTAPPQVLVSLSDRIDSGMAARIVEERLRQPFRSMGELSRVPGGAPLSSELGGVATTLGSLYRITSLARVAESSRIVEAVAQPNGSFLSWQEY